MPLVSYNEFLVRRECIVTLSQSVTDKCWQNKAGPVDICIVISAQLVLFLGGEAAQRLGEVSIWVLAADHEANLAGRVGGDRGVGVFDGWEDLLAVALKLGD